MNDHEIKISYIAIGGVPVGCGVHCSCGWWGTTTPGEVPGRYLSESEARAFKCPRETETS